MRDAMYRHVGLLVPLMSCMLQSGAVHADVRVFCDEPPWLDAVDSTETIDFVGFKSDTVITDQFIETSGVAFTDGQDFISHSCTFTDCAGVRGFTTTTLEFATPRYWLAVDYPGAVEVELYWEGRLMGYAQFCGCCNLQAFGGLVSTEPFDEAILIDWIDDSVHFDNLHFGPVYCPPDTDDDADVDVDDLASVILDWGCTGGETPCAGDVDRDGDVDVDDLTAVILAWGLCPTL